MKNAQDEVNHLRSAMHELEATNQLLKDEYQTLQLTLNSAEQKLVEVQKENSQLGTIHILRKHLYSTKLNLTI